MFCMGPSHLQVLFADFQLDGWESLFFSNSQHLFFDLAGFFFPQCLQIGVSLYILCLSSLFFFFSLFDWLLGACCLFNVKLSRNHHPMFCPLSGPHAWLYLQTYRGKLEFLIPYALQFINRCPLTLTKNNAVKVSHGLYFVLFQCLTNWEPKTLSKYTHKNTPKRWVSVFV